MILKQYTYINVIWRTDSFVYIFFFLNIFYTYCISHLCTSTFLAWSIHSPFTMSLFRPKSFVQFLIQSCMMTCRSYTIRWISKIGWRLNNIWTIIIYTTQRLLWSGHGRYNFYLFTTTLAMNLMSNEILLRSLVERIVTGCQHLVINGWIFFTVKNWIWSRRNWSQWFGRYGL